MISLGLMKKIIIDFAATSLNDLLESHGFHLLEKQRFTGVL